MLPATTQVYQSYPVILDMLRKRGYDVSGYKPLCLEEIEQRNTAFVKQPLGERELSPLPPIVVRYSTPDATHPPPHPPPFADGSCERHELDSIVEDVREGRAVRGCSTAFRRRYPVLDAVVEELLGEQDERTKSMGAPDGDSRTTRAGADTLRTSFDAMAAVYRECSHPIAEVHFHQCFHPTNLWGANSRDKKFMAEMHAMVNDLEVQADDLFGAQVTTLRGHMSTSWDEEGEASMRAELVKLYKASRTVICGYRTRSRASETLDKKYEHHCAELMAQHGVFVQLFNLKCLMYDVTAHEIVPLHEVVDVWHQGNEINRIKRTYNVTNLSKEFPVLPLNDPVAKFIGIRRGQLCRVTRVNDTSGTAVGYRWCK